MRRPRLSLARLIPVLSAVAGVLLTYLLILQTPWAHDLEGRIQIASQGDLQPLQPDPRILILHVNATTAERLGVDGSLTQLPRKHYVDAVRKLRSAGAKVVVFAIPFDTPSAVDDQFRTAISESSPMSIVLVRPLLPGPKAAGQERAFRGNYAAPMPPVQNCLVATAEFVIRGNKVSGLKPFQEDAATGIELPHAAFAGTLKLLGISVFDVRDDANEGRLRAGRRVWPVAKDGVYSTMWVQGAVHESRNFADVLRGEDLSWARDRLIIIGDQATQYKTPIGSKSTAEILAHQITTALQPNQGGLERWPLEWNLGWAFALALVAAIGAVSFRPSMLLGTTVVALLIAVLAPQYGLRIANSVFDTVGPTTATLLAACIALVGEGVARSRKGTGLFQQVSSRKGGLTLDATVMFVELSPPVKAEGTVTETEIFELAEPIVKKLGGEIEQRQAGGIVIILGPYGGMSHAEVALTCLAQIRERVRGEGGVFAGVECGPIPAAWSSIDQSGESRLIGSTIHLASRLVDECRVLGVSTLFGPAFAAELKATTNLRRIGERMIRGFEGHGPIPVYGPAEVE